MTDKRTTYLIERYLTNTISKGELEELKALTTSNYPAEDWVAGIDKLIANLHTVKLPDAPGGEDRIAAIMSKVKEVHHLPPPASKTSLTYWYAIAASLLILLSVGYIYQDALLGPDMQIAEAQPGKIMRVTLADSSQIFLKSGSRLEYPEFFTDNERNVILHGEAFFEISKDPDKPFHIESKDVKVTVLGTSFNVRTDQKGLTEVTVATGKVMVENTSSQLTLTPNQQAVSAPGTELVLHEQVDAYLYTSWKDETVKFNNITMGKAMEILSHRFDIEVNITTPGLEKCLVRAEYSRKSLQSILESLHFISNIEYHYINEKTVEVSGKPCK